MAKQLRVFHQLQTAHSALFRAADALLRDTIGLGNAQQAILFMLVKKDGLSLGEIAKELALGKSGLSGLVDRLEAGGYVERRRDPNDGRGIRLFLLDAGRSIAAAAGPLTKAINEDLLAPFAENERETIARFLTHITNHAGTIVADHTAKHFHERNT